MALSANQYKTETERKRVLCDLCDLETYLGGKLER